MTSATDDFNRASLGGNWTQRRTFFGNVTIITSTYASGAASGLGVQATYPTATSINDQYVSADVVGLGSIFGTSVGVVARMSGQDTSGTDTRTFYYLVATDTATTDLVLGKCVNGTETALATVTTPVVDGNTLRLEVEGTTLRAYLNGVLKATQTDATISTGEVGLTAPSNNIGMDNWAGGDLVTSSTPLMGQACL